MHRLCPSTSNKPPLKKNSIRCTEDGVGLEHSTLASDCTLVHTNTLTTHTPYTHTHRRNDNTCWEFVLPSLGFVSGVTALCEQPLPPIKFIWRGGWATNKKQNTNTSISSYGNTEKLIQGPMEILHPPLPTYWPSSWNKILFRSHSRAAVWRLNGKKVWIIRPS